MQFNGYDFIFYFFPLTAFFYYVANRIKPILGKIVIIIASVVFYSMGRINMLIYLMISMMITYTFAVLIKKFSITSRIIMALPIVINVVLLIYFKYLNFAITNVNYLFKTEYPLAEMILPLGISFYTFQQIVYLVSIEKGELKDNDLIDYLLYILFFPKLVMGPIVEPVDFISQINDQSRKRVNVANIAVEIKIFSLGLIKKVFLADTFAKAVSWVYGNLEVATTVDYILLILFYTFEIYFDFSGYSDMAVGVSAVLNIDLPINFDSPYKAVSIRDFWKRWHISLTSFLTRYIYIPLGGSRKGKVFTYINVLIVFLVSGLWHGANWTFILWGLLHGLLSCLDRILSKVTAKILKPVRWICTFGVVSVLWLLFSASSVEQWKAILFKILSMHGKHISNGIIDTFNVAEIQFLSNSLGLNMLFQNYKGLNVVLFLLVSFIICVVPDNNYKKKNELGIGSMLIASFAFVFGVLCLGAESSFVYFGF